MTENEEIMKLLLLLLICFLPTLSSMADDIEERKITDENVFYFYESRAEFKAPYQELAKYVYSEYLNAQDEFERYDILEQVQPTLEEQLFKFGSSNKVFLEVGGFLAEYDFEKKAFPIRFSKEKVLSWTIYDPVSVENYRQYTSLNRRQSILILFDNRYAVALTNSDVVQFFPLPLDNARELASELRNSRQARFKISGRVVGVKGAAKSHINVKLLEDYGANICCLPEDVEFQGERHMIKLVEIDVTEVLVTLANGKKAGKIDLSP